MHSIFSPQSTTSTTIWCWHFRKEDVPTELRERCHSVRDSDFAEHMMLLISHSRRSRSSDDQLSALGDLGSIVARTRSILEKLSQPTALCVDSRDKLQQYYGLNWIKCPRHNCFYFHEGFHDASRRENHISRHERPFCCTELSCPRIHLGFSTEKELKKHIAIQHPDPAAFAWRFPKVKKATSKHGCTICPKEFIRAHSLKIHMRTHDNERPFKCRFCIKAFDRKDSCERHEKKLHPKQKDSAGSSSMATTSSPVSSGTPLEEGPVLSSRE
jgi:hypothetical protein